MCAINFNVNMSVNSCNDLHTLLFKMSTKNDSKEISEKNSEKVFNPYCNCHKRTCSGVKRNGKGKLYFMLHNFFFHLFFN